MARPKPGQEPGLAWRGRQGHASNTHLWLERVKSQTARWTAGGLSDQAIIDLVVSLPTLARNNPDLFVASANLLRAQCPDPRWQRAMNLRLAIVRRAVKDLRSNMRGDALAFLARNDVWVGKKDLTNGSWYICDGRSLDKFIQQGREGRKILWSALASTPALTSVELPTKHLGQEIWAEALTRVGGLLSGDHPKIRYAIDSGRPWQLAIRRIKRLGVRGLFDPDTQTVIVDPRHPDTLLHELAHWVLNHNHHTDPMNAEREVRSLLNEFAFMDNKSLK